MHIGSADQKAQEPLVDMVIAVHSATRPIGEAVRSLVAGGLEVSNDGGLRITVVCHNISAVTISEGVAENHRALVRFLELNDGIPSPAGPLNHGIAYATGRYVGVMGSDDTVEAGAISGWLSVAEKYRSDAVIAPERYADGRKIRTPVIRVGRCRNLHPVKDRLSYRTAPLGLIRRSEIERLSLRFTPGFPTGDDQEFTSKLWFGGGRIDYAQGSGHYVVGAGATDRVTFARRPVNEELEFVTAMVLSGWFQGRSATERRSIVTKLVRIHVFSLVQTRFDSGGWSQGDREEIAEVLRTLLRHAPDATAPLSIADQRLIDVILDPSTDPDELQRRAVSRRRFGRPDTLVPKSLRSAMHPESPLRIMPAAALLR